MESSYVTFIRTTARRACGGCKSECYRIVSFGPSYLNFQKFTVSAGEYFLSTVRHEGANKERVETNMFVRCGLCHSLVITVLHVVGPRVMVSSSRYGASGECIEEAVADRRQGVSFSLGVVVCGANTSRSVRIAVPTSLAVKKRIK
jgi:hypothetical protein